MGIKLEDLIRENKAPILEDRSKKIMNGLIIAIIVVVILIVIITCIILSNRVINARKERVKQLIIDTNRIGTSIQVAYNKYRETGDESLLIGVPQFDRQVTPEPINLDVGGQLVEYKYGYYYVTASELPSIDSSLSLLELKNENYLVNYSTGEAINLTGVNYNGRTYYDKEDLLAIQQIWDGAKGVVPPSDYTVYINSAADMDKIRQYPDYRYKLCKDIDMSYYNSTEGWEPVAEFTGYFDGRGYTISNLFVARPENKYSGLFGHVTEGGDIYNLVLKDVDISGGEYTGAIAGSSSGKAINCRVEGGKISSSNNRIGGAFGNFSGTASDVVCVNLEVNGGEDVGGFAGVIDGGSVNKCTFEGKVGGNIDVGGFAGEVAASKALSISETFAKANVSAEIRNAGGFAGHLNVSSSRELKLEDSYSNGAIEYCRNSTGGFFGEVFTTSGANVILSRLYTTSDTPYACESARGGFTGTFTVGSSLSNNYCYWEFDQAVDVNQDGTYVKDIGDNKNAAESAYRFESKTPREMKTSGAFSSWTSSAQVWNIDNPNDLPRFKWEGK